MVIRVSKLTSYDTGDVIADPSRPMDQMWILLEGRVAIFVDRGSGPRRAMEWGPGSVTGLLPYSRMTTPPGTSRVLEPITVLRMPATRMPDFILEAPALTAMTVHIMLDRARSFNSADLHDEKMVSLGRLSAGLAHELNNPASAAASDARSLGTEILAVEAAARALGAAGLTTEQFATLERVRDRCLGDSSSATVSAADRLNREEEIMSWLESRGADPEYAAHLSESPVSVENLDLLERTVPPEALDVSIRWGRDRVRGSRPCEGHREVDEAHPRAGLVGEALLVHGPRTGRGTRRSRTGPSGHAGHAPLEGAGEVAERRARYRAEPPDRDRGAAAS